MTFLPIIERELRVATRKRSTFWLRTLAALVALVLGGAILVLHRIGAFGPSALGHALFSTLTWLALLTALSAGLFFTADCLSAEKREGTLGFLFLTDLRGYDVVGGKLFATSLRVAYALLSVTPILAVTFLLGAVSGSQYWKTALALLNALFCSLAAGLMVSALSRDAQRALGATALLLLLLVLGGPGFDHIYNAVRHGGFKPALGLTSPGYTFILAGAWGRSPYWPALGISHALGWAMLAVACLTVPASWREKGRKATLSRRSYWWRFGGAKRRQALGRKWLDRDPILWLSCRERWQATVIWAMALVMACVLAALGLEKAPIQIWLAWKMTTTLFLMLLYLWVASQAGRFFLEARRSGFLELLLATPLTVSQTVHGHWRALVRMLGPPVAAVLLLELAGALVAFSATTWVGGPPVQWIQVVACGICATTTLSALVSLAALAWVGMWMGMTSKTTGLAALKTILFVKVIPALVIYFVAMYAVLFLVVMPQALKMRATPAPPVTTTITNAAGTTTTVTTAVAFAPRTSLYMSLLRDCLPAVLNVAVGLGFIALARRRLLATFRQRAVPHLALPPRIGRPHS